MSKLFFIPFIISCFVFVSCSDKKQSTDKILEKNTIVVKEKKKTKEKKDLKLERLPAKLVQMIFKECNSIDGTFYDGDKSFNLWDDNVKYVLSMITEEAPKQLNNKINGHLMLLNNGNQIAFVEISMVGNNNYVVYQINDAKYYNKINAKGIKFFSKFLTPTAK